MPFWEVQLHQHVTAGRTLQIIGETGGQIGLSLAVTGLTAGLLPIPILGGVVGGLASNATTQLVWMGAGAQQNFDWGQFVASGVAGGVGDGMTRALQAAGQAMGVSNMNLLPRLAFKLGLGLVDGMATDLAFQTTAIALGSQDGFNVTQFLTAGATGAALGLFMQTCFTGDTPLLTPEGSKRIDEFRIGDKLLSQSEFAPDGAVEEKQVEEIFVRVSAVLNLHVSGRIIRTTAEHPFYVVGKGWVAAAFLRNGDLLQSHDKRYIPVARIADGGEVTTVYNLRVADYHTYFVGSPMWGCSIWAHNRCGEEIQREINEAESKLAAGGLSQKQRQQLTERLFRLRQELPPQTSLSGGHSWDTQTAPDTSTPNSLYTHIDPKTGRALQNTIYGNQGQKIAQVDFQKHGDGVWSGHGHYFGDSANEWFGHHGSGAPHVDYPNLPTGWDRLPPGILPHAPIGF
jgi:hypothetical protein